MRIKLWMTLDHKGAPYTLWALDPDWWGNQWMGGSRILGKLEESEIPEHLRFKAGGESAIRQIEMELNFPYDSFETEPSTTHKHALDAIQHPAALAGQETKRRGRKP